LKGVTTLIFILDNFDSFTFNLYQYFGQLGEYVVTRRRDECTIEDIEGLKPELIVISPGPCAPRDAPLTLKIIDYFKGKIPIFGVCLGHQAIGEIFGVEVVRAKKPVHGKVSKIKHDEQGVFFNLPNPLTVTRYHSLALDRKSIPDELMITAETDDGEIMGIRHRELPIEGVQFHPEAILTENGHELLANAVAKARAWWKKQQANSSPWIVKELNLNLPPIQLLKAFRESEYPFFLDSGKGYGELGRYSFMGAFPFLQASAYREFIELSWFDSFKKDVISNVDGPSLPILDSLIERFQVNNPTEYPFVGGAVGYLSYDLKDELERLPQKATNDSHIPLWRFAWYDGILVYDHETSHYHILSCGMTESGECQSEVAQFRLNRLENLLKDFMAAYQNIDYLNMLTAPLNSGEGRGQELTYTLSKDKYLLDCQKVIDYIYAGDIYQANFTQRFQIPCSKDPIDLYQVLHEQNPAPFAAFLRYDDFQILSTSPERFIRIDREGKIVTNPIKGTRPRGKTQSEDEALAQELSKSIKDRAELTMIIDLERNDLGRICEYNSVQVTDLIRLEKYPTVWHLVSTIEGTLKPNLKASEILKAIFPGGSITGAPKIRAMEIIEELEPYKRGIYTGSIGYIGFDKAWDLNIVIRTILLKDGQAYFNGGGGIVADSIPEDEYQESLQKVKALIQVLGGGKNELY
jgi:para-aminobenzoate synthetase